MVGTVEPRKAYDKALDAFERLWAEDQHAPDLIIVGKPGWKTSELQDRIRAHPERGRRLRWLEGVSDEALTQLYDACTAVFLASFDEGFGLPVVEAATHGRWVLARDLPVFREQGLGNLRYFRDDSPAALARELLGLIRVAKNGSPDQGDLPSWNDCVQQLLRDMGISDGSVSAAVLPLRKAS
jgi:glycosyltransferase involved in cell wall biosynthesis